MHFKQYAVRESGLWSEVLQGFFDVEVYSYASYIQVSMPFLVHNTCSAFEEQLFLPTFLEPPLQKDPVTYF